MEFTFYFIAAAVFLALIGYFVGAGRISLGPVVIIAVILVLSMPLLISSAIWIYGSSTPEVEVPNVLGQTSSEAVSVLQSTGLNYDISGVSFSKEESGIVISQSPESGKKVKAGREINLIISAKERGISIPNFIGKTSQEAEAMILQYGLSFDKVYSEASTEAFGIVIRQDPQPGSIVTSGFPLSITISAGSPNK